MTSSSPFSVMIKALVRKRHEFEEHLQLRIRERKIDA
jgi:hypothetical protein